MWFRSWLDVLGIGTQPRRSRSGQRSGDRRRRQSRRLLVEGLEDRRLLTFLATIRVMADDATNRRHVESLIADANALNDHSNFLGDNLVFLLDASLGLISLEQNNVMKIFSVFAVVFMPPTLIAGVYGMNFDHMPELKWLLGYPFALALILASAVLPYMFARRRGWL